VVVILHTVCGKLSDKTYRVFENVSRIKFGADVNHLSKALEEAVVL
jgi:hypothetical protein